jgi:16S rRNA processing protein RimM
MTQVCVGAIAGAFGVRGEVRLKSFCAEPSDLDSYGPLSDESGKREFAVKITRPIKAGFAARIASVKTKEDADALKGTRLYLPRERLPDLEDEEYYHSDLIGLDVFDTGGEKIGKIKAIFENGATDLLEIHGPGLKNGVMLPFTKEIVPTIDLSQRRIITDPPEGLLP